MCNKNTSADPAAERGDQPEGFEHLLADLQQIVLDLESGELQLTESLERYELGIRRLKQCHQFLEAAEQRISQLVGFDADGNPLLESIDSGAAQELEGKQPARQRRRSAKSASPEGDSRPSSTARAGRRGVSESMDEPPELF